MMMRRNLRIIYMGTPEFSAIILEKMISTGYVPMTVVTAPDKPIGRKQIITPSPVKVLAEKNKIPVLQSENIRNLKLEIRNLQPELIILAAYGQIIPKDILDIPRYGSINVHPSLLPKYRGASPIQAAILNGDSETGVTIMLMDEKLDHGPILANSKCQIADNTTYKELHDKLAEIGAELLIETVSKWINGEIKAQPQDHSKATFTKIIKKEDGHINWHKPADYIEKMCRAFNPWPSVYTYLKFQIPNDKFQIKSKSQIPKILKIIKASVLKIEHKKTAGRVFLTENEGRRNSADRMKAEKKLAVACGQDALILEEVQLEGKRRMTAKEFLNGYPQIIGLILN